VTVRGVPPRARRDGDARGVAKTRGWVARTVAIGSVEEDHVASFDESKKLGTEAAAASRSCSDHGITLPVDLGKVLAAALNFFRETLPPPAIR
jgi:hypothetical protein